MNLLQSLFEKMLEDGKGGHFSAYGLAWYSWKLHQPFETKFDAKP